LIHFHASAICTSSSETSWLPAKERVSTAGVADEYRRITRAARGGFEWDDTVTDHFGRCDHFLDPIAACIAEGPCAALTPLEKMLERQHVRVCDIANVNVIAYAGAIRRVVVLAKNANGLSRARRCKYQGN